MKAVYRITPENVTSIAHTLLNDPAVVSYREHDAMVRQCWEDLHVALRRYRGDYASGSASGSFPFKTVGWLEALERDLTTLLETTRGLVESLPPGFSGEWEYPVNANSG